MFILSIFAKIFYFCEKIAKFHSIFAFRENLLEKHKSFPQFYVYFINFSRKFAIFAKIFAKTKIFATIFVKQNFAKFRLIFAFRENLKTHFRFNPTCARTKVLVSARTEILYKYYKNQHVCHCKNKSVVTNYKMPRKTKDVLRLTTGCLSC